MKYLTLTIILAIFASAGFAQPKKIAFEKYDVAEGLPERFVTGLIQDDKGFIWAGTQNGLVKYDGYKFTVYKESADTSKTKQLQLLNLIGGLLKTSDGKLWMGGFSSEKAAIASFDPVTEEFNNYFQPSIRNRFGFCILGMEDAHQNLWFAYFKGELGGLFETNLCRLNRTDLSITVYQV